MLWVCAFAGLPGEMFASVDKALDERTIGHNPERLNLLKGGIIYSNKVVPCPACSRRGSGVTHTASNKSHVLLSVSQLVSIHPIWPSKFVLTPYAHTCR